MAKKRKTEKKKESEKKPENVLPQNILPVGERVEENKNIYISQKTYKEIHRFTRGKTTNESGGVLVGNVIEEFGKTNIIINGFIEGRNCEATPTTLKFTHETWKQIHNELDKKYPGQKIVGWIHTHPDFGIFLSEYDKFIQTNFFNGENQIAYVVDPIQKIEGFYFWINGNIERCKGFYIFDKTGERITPPSEKSEEEEKAVERKPSNAWKIVCGILGAAVVVMAVILASFNSELKDLRTKVSALVYSVNKSMTEIQTYLDLSGKTVESVRKDVESMKEMFETPEQGESRSEGEGASESDTGEPADAEEPAGSTETDGETGNGEETSEKEERSPSEESTEPASGEDGDA